MSRWFDIFTATLSRNALVDPREMVHQIQSDFKSSRFAAVVLAVICGLGVACWFQALSSRNTARVTPSSPPQMTVLPDPFEKS
jgi:hypothetical protein